MDSMPSMTEEMKLQHQSSDYPAVAETVGFKPCHPSLFRENDHAHVVTQRPIALALSASPFEAHACNAQVGESSGYYQTFIAPILFLYTNASGFVIMAESYFSIQKRTPARERKQKSSVLDAMKQSRSVC